MPLSQEELAALDARYRANNSPAAQAAALDAKNAVFRMRAGIGPSEGYARVAQYQEPGTEAFTRYVDKNNDWAGAIDHNAGTVGGVVPSFVVPVNVGSDGIASAMERADQFNGAQPNGYDTPGVAQPESAGIDIAAVNERRNQILQGIDPDRPAIFVTPQRKQQLNHELGVLTGIAREHAQTSAKQAHQDFLAQRHIDTGNQVSGFFTELAASKTALGTPEHTQEVSELAAKYPLALGTSGVRDTLKTHLNHHLAASNFATPPEGTQLARVVQTSDGKSHAVFEPIPTEDGNTKVPSGVVSRYSELQGKLQLHQDQSDSERIKNIADKKENVPYTKAPQLHEFQKEASLLEKKYPQLKQLTSDTAAPPEKIDLNALAQKALDDPNAPENVKAAARKRLGK